MDKQRAEEIAQSADMKNVVYNGQNIYIQHVNNQGTARVFPLDDPEREFDAQLTQLIERI